LPNDRSGARRITTTGAPYCCLRGRFPSQQRSRRRWQMDAPSASESAYLTHTVAHAPRVSSASYRALQMEQGFFRSLTATRRTVALG